MSSQESNEEAEAKAKVGRKTDAERAERQAALERAEREAAAEAKRAKPIDPQRAGALGFTLAIGAIIFATSALFSFATVASAAEWMKPSWPWLAWVVPGFVEAFIIYFGMDTIINQARGDAKAARSALVWMFVFASVAVAANATHTVAGWHGNLASLQALVGTAMSALAPLSVVLITKRVSRLVFSKGN